MAAADSLIPELEDVIQHGSAERRSQTLKKITDLFLNGASQFNDEHVGLFDDVFNRLINEIEAKARAELSNRLAPVGNAPLQLVRRLAKDDDIAVAGPLLQQSRQLDEADLIFIAKIKSQAHLLAISGRRGIGEPVTDLLVQRGDRDVIRSVAENRGARLSDESFATLVTRAGEDDVLAENLGTRPDIPSAMFRNLLQKATAVVQQRLLASISPEMQADIRRVLAKVTEQVETQRTSRDYSAAQRRVAVLRHEGKLNEAQLVTFAKDARYEEMVAALALLCAVPIEVVDRLMSGDRPDPILILGKSAGWPWPTVKTIILARIGGKDSTSQGLDTAYMNYERLSPATAERVMRFWQARPSGV
jgi:uncharacterized protein (DUF2336 family)